MPNHVTTKCIVTGPEDEIKRFRDLCIKADSDDGDPSLDFSTIIPMPEILNGTVAGGDTNLGIEILTGSPRPDSFGGRTTALDYTWVKDEGITTLDELKAWCTKNRPEVFIEGQKALDAYKETGFYDWYDWSVETWGTKWNSYSFRVDSEGPGHLTFYFDTAWSFPEPVFNKLGEMFPTLSFLCACFDEGWNFAGVGSFNGEPPFEFFDADKNLYELVFGHPYESDDHVTYDEDNNPISYDEDDTPVTHH